MSTKYTDEIAVCYESRKGKYRSNSTEANQTSSRPKLGVVLHCSPTENGHICVPATEEETTRKGTFHPHFFDGGNSCLCS